VCLWTLVQTQVLVSKCWRLLLKVPAAGAGVGVYAAPQALQMCMDAVTLAARSEMSASEQADVLC